MLIETKHTKITAELEQRITGGYYREKLPPLRALMKEYQVSLQTISKAVKPLILSGLISPGPRGSAINHASAVRERYDAWGFLCSGSAEMTDVTHDFFQLIHRCLARDSYNMLFLDGRNKRLRQDMDFWEKQPIDGLVFGYGTLTAELARTVHRAGIAGVARHHAGNLPVHVVEYDTFSSIDFVIGKIVEKGYRRIALQFKASLEGYQEYADKNWEQIRRKYDIAFPEYRENVMPGHSLNAWEQHTRYLCADTPPEILLCWHAEAEGTYQELKKMGLHRKVKLVSYLSHWQQEGHFIPLEKIREEEYWQTVYEVLREVMKTKPAEMIHRKVPYFPRFMQELPEAK